MSYTLINVSVPYVIEYVRRGCSKVESGIFWEDRTVVIQSITAAEAPVAFRVRAEGQAFPEEYSVRSFDGRLWWPMFDGTRPFSSKSYIAGVSRSDGLFLAMMNLSPATVVSPRRDAKQFYARKVDAPQRMERLSLAQRMADRTLFCDDELYVEGGPPVYFAIKQKDRSLSIEVGNAEPAPSDMVGRHLAGPRPDRRRDAACRSLVYGAESVDEKVDALRRQGIEAVFGSRVESASRIRSEREAVKICADALVRRAVSAIDTVTRAKLSSQIQRLILSTRQIPPTLCRQTIAAMFAASPQDDFTRCFRIRFEWADEALSRLDAIESPFQLTERDEQILSSVANSVLVA